MKKLIALTALIFLVLATAIPALAGNPFTLPVFYAETSSGRPLAGGLVFTFEAGTTTPKAAFTDRLLTVEAANPIVLDANGQAVFYLGGIYKINLKDSAGVQRPNFPVDNVQGVFQVGDSVVKFFVDVANADQGAVGNGKSVKDIVDANGATKLATLVFSRSTDTTNTDYVFSTSETITANFMTEFENGARLDPDSGKVVAFAGGTEQVIATPDQQIKTGSGTITFAKGGVGYAEWVGPVDGTADDIEINAIAVTGVSTVKLLTKTYIGNAQITIPKNVNLIGRGRENTILDFDGATGAFPDDGAIYAAGDGLVSLGALAGSITKGSKTVTLGSAPDVSAGDVIVIFDSADSSYSGFRTNYRAGEYGVVHSIAGNNITLTAGTYAAYTTGGTRIVYKLNTTSTQIKDLQVIGIGTGSAVDVLRLKYARGALLENLKVTGGEDKNVIVRNSFNVTVRNLDSRKLLPDAGTTTSYALSIGNSQSIRVYDSYLIAVRHAITTGGGSEDGDVVNRDIQVENSTLIGTSAILGAQFHGNTEYSSFRDNYMTGAQISGNFNSIINNIIRKEGAQPYAIHLSELSGFDHTIIGNRVNIDTAPSELRGAFVNVGGNEGSLTSDTTTGGTLNISDNEVFYAVEDDEINAVRIVNRGSTQADLRIVYENNTLIGTYSTRGHNYGLDVDVVSGAAWKEVRAVDNIQFGFGMNIEGAISVFVDGNSIEKSGQQGMKIQEDSVIAEEPDLYTVTNNTVKESRLTGIFVQGNAAEGIIRARIEHNTSIENVRADTGSSNANSDLFVSKVKEVYSRDNILGSAEGDQDQPAFYGTITTLHESENDYYGTIDRPVYSSVDTFADIRERVLGSDQAVDMKTAGKTTIFTVPTGSKAVITKVIVHGPSASLAGGTDYDLGSGANADTWLQTNNLSGMTATTDYRVITSENAEFTLEAAGATFGIKVITGSTGAATATVEVVGYLIPG